MKRWKYELKEKREILVGVNAPIFQTHTCEDFFKSPF